MAEKVEIIEIDASESVRTLKDLKDEIKDLRKTLDNCEIGSEKFTKTLDELTDAQTELKNATKSSNDALEGSYDALSQKMSELKKVWRATADEAERASLGAQIAEINTQLKDMDAEIGNYQRNVGNYGSAFDDVTLKIEGGVARFDKFNGATRAVIGSFDLVEGGLKAIGVESEEVNNLMDSMQGAMMLTNGLNSVKEGVQAFNSLRTSVTAATTAQNALNAAQMANPIGLIVAAVAALIAGLTALVVVIGKNRDEERQLQEAYEATNRAIEDRIEAQELEIELMEARGAAQSEILAQELVYAETNLQNTKDRIAALEKELEATGSLRFKKKDILKGQIEDLKESLKNQEQAVKDANNAILLYNTRVAREQTEQEQKEAEERAKIAENERKRKLEQIRKEKEQILKIYSDLTKELSEYWLDEFELREKRLSEWVEKSKKSTQDALDKGLISQEEYNRRMLEIDKIYADKKQVIENDRNAETKKATEDLLSQYDQLQETIIESKLSAQEIAIRNIDKLYNDELKLLKELNEKKLISEEEYQAGLLAIQQKAEQAKQVATQQTTEEVQKETEEYGALGFKITETGVLAKESQEKIATGVNLVGNAFGQTSQLLTTLANNQDKNTKEGFENYKKLAIASATMSMLQSIISSWTSAMSLPAPMSFITGGVMSAFSATMGAIQIDQIKKQQFGGSTSTPTASTPSVNTTALLSTPINYTTDVQGASAIDTISDTRVYVVESDITETMNKVAVAEEESVF